MSESRDQEFFKSLQGSGKGGAPSMSTGGRPVDAPRSVTVADPSGPDDVAEQAGGRYDVDGVPAIGVGHRAAANAPEAEWTGSPQGSGTAPTPFVEQREVSPAAQQPAPPPLLPKPTAPTSAQPRWGAEESAGAAPSLVPAPVRELAGSGVRPPKWDWGGPAGGNELRSEQISAAELIAPRKIPSSRGWRKLLYKVSFGAINTGESPDEQVLRGLRAAVATNLRGTYSVVILGGKGGVGKTSMAAAIGSTVASLRKDKTIALDANPDRASNLADRIDPTANSSYKEVLSDQHLLGYSDIRSHVGQNQTGLDVLGNRHQSDRPPLNTETYSAAHDALKRFYSVLISDSGTDVDHAVVPGLMGNADALIMVASTAPDGAKGAAELVDWAYEAGYHQLLNRTVVVINDVHNIRGKRGRALVDSLAEKFTRWVGDGRVFIVPFDPHIASAGVIEIDQLRPATRRRILEITAKIAGGFTSSEDRQ